MVKPLSCEKGLPVYAREVKKYVHNTEVGRPGYDPEQDVR